MSFAVEDFQDLMHLLEARPEWRADLRRIVLTDELLALPEQVNRLQAETDRRFRELAGQVATLTEQVTALTEAQKRIQEQLLVLIEAQTRTDQQIAGLTQAVSVLQIDTGELKGQVLEMRYQARAPAYLGRLIRRSRVLSSEKLARLLEDAVEQGQITDAEKNEVMWADVVVRGRSAQDGAEVYLVVEVSWGVGISDVERAVQRAAVLSKLGIPALPVVAGMKITDDAAYRAGAMQVWQVIDGKTVGPQSTTAPAA